MVSGFSFFAASLFGANLTQPFRSTVFEILKSLRKFAKICLMITKTRRDNEKGEYYYLDAKLLTDIK